MGSVAYHRSARRLVDVLASIRKYIKSRCLKNWFKIINTLDQMLASPKKCPLLELTHFYQVLLLRTVQSSCDTISGQKPTFLIPVSYSGNFIFIYWKQDFTPKDTQASKIMAAKRSEQAGFQLFVVLPARSIKYGWEWLTEMFGLQSLQFITLGMCVPVFMRNRHTIRL